MFCILNYKKVSPSFIISDDKTKERNFICTKMQFFELKSIPQSLWSSDICTEVIETY